MWHCFPIISFPLKNKTGSTNYNKVFSKEEASFRRHLALSTLYNLSYMGAFPETINFLKYTRKFSIFKLVTRKLVPRHIVFVFISTFGEKELRIQGKLGRMIFCCWRKRFVPSWSHQQPFKWKKETSYRGTSPTIYPEMVCSYRGNTIPCSLGFYQDNHLKRT